MAADDDVAHAERGDGIFDGRRHAAVHRRERRDDVAGVAADEEVAGLRLEDMLGHHARIRAGDHQRLGLLPLAGETGEQFAAVGENDLLEAEYATDQFVHGCYLSYDPEE